MPGGAEPAEVVVAVEGAQRHQPGQRQAVAPRSPLTPPRRRLARGRGRGWANGCQSEGRTWRRASR